MPITPEIEAEAIHLKAEFVERYGREPRLTDPVFWDVRIPGANP